MTTHATPDTYVLTLELNGRTVRIVVPSRFDWMKYSHVDVSTWLGGYRT